MEDSGFKAYKNFKLLNKILTYMRYSTSIGDFGAVVACEKFDKGIPSRNTRYSGRNGRS